ncbi:MAG TPA: glycogen debranching protein GlgX [Elusimicrobiota bacterium]|nr:glycogen debranching protein GlgX [Elusimicrobiota bacterium]
MRTAAADVELGSSFPLGSRVDGAGVNFSLYSKHARAVDLLLFDGAEAPKPSRTITLEPPHHRTYHYWHAHVAGVGAGQVYAYRVHGPDDPSKGLRFNSDKVLFDPYSHLVIRPKAYSRAAACGAGDNAASAFRSVVCEARGYDWEGDRPLDRPYESTVIYEMHVGGFTRHPSSGVAPERRGTYAGVIDKIPYLKDLGVTAVELLPVFEFDPSDAPAGLTNYWGYSPVSFFSPHRGYSSRRDLLGPVTEFRDMVKALHRAGIEVILDVVFNHTTEGNENGPTLSYRGFDNEAYYMLAPNPAEYMNFSGCGNTLNSNHPIARRLILDSLRYWVHDMHVDGFRFDLASILSRDESGRPVANPPVLLDIESDPVLASTRLIAEAWDPGGLYQVGNFVGDSWLEWNGRFRDDVRSFLKGDEGMVPRLSERLVGSPDLFEHEQREPEESINFLTCHDGFTLNDVFSYDSKHNEANGEGNRDGSDDNRSWNCGAEGPTNDPAVEALRNRQVKNALAILLFSTGTPMLLMGDEVRRTQKGNNNAYCQDNELSWFDWSLVERHADVRRFAKLMIEARLHQRPWKDEDDRTLNELLRRMRVEWHGTRLFTPRWGDGESRRLAATFHDPEGKYALHAMFNAHWEAAEFELPVRADGQPRRWHLWLDTAAESPRDIWRWNEAPHVAAPRVRVEPRSTVIVFSARL